MADLGGAVGRVDRRERGAGSRDSVEDDRELGQVRRHQGDAGARAHASGGESAGEAARCLLEFGERVLVPRPVGNRNAIRVGRRLVEDIVGDRHLGDVDVGQAAGVDEAHAGLRWADRRSDRSLTPEPERRLTAGGTAASSADDE